MINRLLTRSVHNPFASNFVVGLEGVTQILDTVLFVVDVGLYSVGQSNERLLGVIIRLPGFQVTQALLNTGEPLFLQIVDKVVVQCQRVPV